MEKNWVSYIGLKVLRQFVTLALIIDKLISYKRKVTIIVYFVISFGISCLKGICIQFFNIHN